MQLIRLPGRGPAAICSSCQSLCERWVEGHENVKAVPTFGQGLLEALAYPVRGDGIFMLVGAVVLGVVVDLLGRWVMFSWIAWLAGLVIGAYFLQFFREVLLSSANGESRIPQWPDFDRENLLESYLQFLAVYLICFGPWLASSLWLGALRPDLSWLPWVFLGMGLLYFPMALLAVVLLDSFSGLNPVVVGCSIARVPLRYLAVCGFAAAAVGALFGIQLLAGRLRIPIIAPAAEGFAAFYFAVAAFRALGWFYFHSKEKLSWS